MSIIDYIIITILISSNMETLVLDFSKLKCKEHPLDLITNFCLNGIPYLN